LFSKSATYLAKALLDGTSDAQTPDSANAQLIVFHPAKIYKTAISQAQVNVHKRTQRAFVARGHLEWHAASDMAR